MIKQVFIIFIDKVNKAVAEKGKVFRDEIVIEVDCVSNE